MRARVLGIVALAACTGAHHPTASGGDTDHARALARSTATTGRTWRVGVGVDGCTVGATMAACEAALGPATPDPADVQLSAFTRAGVEVFVDDTTVVRVFVRYRRTGFAAYVGSDPGGIGAGATPSRVIYAYGPPTGERDAEDGDGTAHVLDYADRALAFAFRDGTLASVTIGVRDAHE